ncbi:MAG: tetratricopeptide repeat protein [Anaerolineales bacterium]|nr:tetratricopeptide repeat protein [Anaerolineales bacterium]
MPKRNLIFTIFMGIFLFASLVAGLGWLSRQDSVDIQALSAADHLYEAGHYNEATKIYTQLIAQGVQSSAVYYNLGNAYYQQGDLGRAILNYQRAAHLDPRDKNIQLNLALARQEAVNLYPQELGGPLKTLADLTGKWLTINETAWLVLSFWFVLGFLLIIRRQLRHAGSRSGVEYFLLLMLFIFLIGGLSFGSRIYLERAQPGGVIVAPVIAVSNAPSLEEPSELQLHSGTEVHIKETLGDWIRLDLPGENEDGWIPLEAVEFIANDLRTGHF